MKERILKLLGAFVQFHTTEECEPQKLACLEWISSTFLQGRSHSTQSSVRHCPYLWLEHPNPRLLWFAHIDVVPGLPEQFTLRLDGDRAYARGAKDMKGGALPFLLALCDAWEEGTQPPVSILLTSDEEIAGETIPLLLKNGTLKGPVAYTPDSGRGTSIITEHKGALWAEILSRGKGGHAAYPWEGECAIDSLLQALIVLQKHFPPQKNPDWVMTVTLTRLSGGDAKNKIPDEARCTLDIRFPPEVARSGRDVLQMIRRVLPENCSISILREAPPLYTDPNHEMVQLLKKITEEVTNEEVLIGREHGASDARFFNEAGIPAFIHGPTGGSIHSTDEWVSVKSLCDQYEISRRLLRELEAR